jgi:hypothetical protein
MPIPAATPTRIPDAPTPFGIQVGAKAHEKNPVTALWNAVICGIREVEINLIGQAR